ncbi:hypothetical protein ACEUZ9_004126 [Paracoccus litorisediminis]|uniref:hypothetical protein n=1 Tax=Paracoccus litorisediminis TaxID=2006130 RepID=UPI00373018A9
MAGETNGDRPVVMMMAGPIKLLEITQSHHVDPDIFLDIQGQVIGSLQSAQLFSEVRNILPQILRRRSKIIPCLMDLHQTAMALAMRLRAAARLDPLDWMEDLWRRALSDREILERIGSHFSAAPLRFDPGLQEPVFDEVTSKAALHPDFRSGYPGR